MSEAELNRFKWLCEQIESEQDHRRLMLLVAELNAFLEMFGDSIGPERQQFQVRAGASLYKPNHFVLPPRNNGWINDLLKSAIEGTNADYGNIQLFDSSQSSLKIVAHKGFDSEFLTHFETVRINDDCACGAAMKERSRVVITDVMADPIFLDGSREVLLRANVRSVQSTPLINSSGLLIGMLSTHHRRPGGPAPGMNKHIDRLAVLFTQTFDKNSD